MEKNPEDSKKTKSIISNEGKLPGSSKTKKEKFIKLENIKSSYIIKRILSFCREAFNLNLIKYNKYFQSLLSINIENYKKKSGIYKEDGINGFGREFSLTSDYNKLLFEGEYKNKKRNGKGKEYSFGEIKFEGEYLNGKRIGKGKEYSCGEIIFEGEYLNGLRNGKGKEYRFCYGNNDYNYKPIIDENIYDTPLFLKANYNRFHFEKIFEGEYLNGLRNGNGKEFYSNGRLKFEGEYLNGKRWNGIGYTPINNDIIYQVKNGTGKVKEYYPDGKLKFEGEYLNGEIHGKFKQYSIEYKVIEFWQCEQIENTEIYYLFFEGEYLCGKRSGKGKKYGLNEKGVKTLIFEGEYLNDERNGKGKEFYYNTKLKYEGEYLNDKRNGKGKEYYENEKLKFEGEYLKGERWNGKVYEYYSNNNHNKLKFEGEYVDGKKWNGKGYDINNKIIFTLTNGNGKIKEYNNFDKLQFEGEYLNGEKNGKGIEYYDGEKLAFEGEYLNGLKSKGKEYYYNIKLKYEGVYLNEEPWNGKEYQYNYNGELEYETIYINGLKKEKKIK